MVGSCFFIGTFFGSFILPRKADVVGRKTIFILGLVLYVISIVGLLVSRQQHMLYLMMVLGGVSETSRYYVAYVYAIEILPKRLQDYGGLCIFLLFACFKVMICLYLLNDPERSWKPLAYLAIMLALFSLVGTLLFLPESPRFLYSKNQLQQTTEVLKFI